MKIIHHLYSSEFQRYCCECGKFNFCELIWYSHCTFHLIWASLALSWMIGVRRPLDDDNEYFKVEMKVGLYGIDRLTNNQTNN